MQLPTRTTIDKLVQNAACRIPLSTSQWESESGRLAVGLKGMAALWNRANATLRSARGHWKIQSTTKHFGVDFGPALQCLPDGSYQPRIETQARIHGIDSLLATLPWADIVDMKIFLDGFEAGAQWCRNNQNLDSGEDKRAGA